MTLLIRRYAPEDKDSLVILIEGLQDYLSSIDPLQRLRRLPDYGVKYTDALLDKVSKNDGAIYVAETSRRSVGCIAGIVETQNDVDKLGASPSKCGRVLELFVVDGYKGQDIGYFLMECIEDYFKNAGCDAMRVEVFAANTGAQKFYNRMGYDARCLDLIKTI